MYYTYVFNHAYLSVVCLCFTYVQVQHYRLIFVKGILCRSPSISWSLCQKPWVKSVKCRGGLVSNYFAFQKTVFSLYYRFWCYFLVNKICGLVGKMILFIFYLMSIFSATIWKVIQILESSNILSRLKMVTTELLFKYHIHLIDQWRKLPLGLYISKDREKIWLGNVSSWVVGLITFLLSTSRYLVMLNNNLLLVPCC